MCDKVTPDTYVTTNGHEMVISYSDKEIHDVKHEPHIAQDGPE